MNFLKSNLFKYKYHIPTLQKHGHSVPMFSTRGQYFKYFAHIQITWAFHAHVF